MAVARTATRAKATKVIDTAPAGLDLYLGPTSGDGRMQRLDLEIRQAADGNLRLDVEIPRQLAPAVALLTALGVNDELLHPRGRTRP
jgi:hypothetical protein